VKHVLQGRQAVGGGPITEGTALILEEDGIDFDDFDGRVVIDVGIEVSVVFPARGELRSSTEP
jgi:hypothetical protein